MVIAALGFGDDVIANLHGLTFDRNDIYTCSNLLLTNLMMGL